MLKTIHGKKNLQLGIGFITGILFGFLLQKGGVTKYDVIIGQLLLTDFTVIKIMPFLGGDWNALSPSAPEPGPGSITS